MSTHDRLRKIVHLIFFSIVLVIGVVAQWRHSQVATIGPAAAASLAAAGAPDSGSDGWPEWRGANRDGISPERGLPDRWSPAGENLLWRAPFGGRSTPVVWNGRVYLQTSLGRGPSLQERIICFDANSGKVLWEHHYNVFMSDVPPHRIAWSSPAADRETGNIFAISGGGLLMSLSPQGKVLWERSLAEEMGMWTTHGGRMSSPLIDGRLVIVSGITYLWGAHAGGSHRYIAFDKHNGQVMWISAPEGRPTDTIYASPVVTDAGGMRLFVSGGSDGAMHAIKVATGEPVWNWKVSQRGLNTAALVAGPNIIVTHSEENVASSEMGMVASVPSASKGTLTDQQATWVVRGVQGGYSSPVTDGAIVYQVDNGAQLFAFDLKSGKQLWVQNLGTIQKSSPVLGDGKLYVGTENGKFYIIQPSAAGAKVLDEDWLGSEQKPEAIIASPAVADGRIYLVSIDAIYAIGLRGTGASQNRYERKQPPSASTTGGIPPAPQRTEALPSPSTILVAPTELLLKPGDKVKFTATSYNANGSMVKTEIPTWSLEQLGGAVTPDGTYTASVDRAQAGLVKATIGSLTGTARVRVIPPLPLKEDFEAVDDKEVPNHWINTRGKFVVRAVDGNKVLVKTADNPFAFIKRTRPFFGSPDWSNYTVEADAMAMERRRVMGDLGIVGHRYSLVLFGTHQRVELQSWQPETERTPREKFEWKPDVWYRLKLRVERMPDGKVRAQGKVWPRGQAEPAAWTIERVDPIGNVKGAPGLYADVPPAAEIFFDNISVYPNQS